MPSLFETTTRLHSSWAEQALFYHVYALGQSGAPARAGDETGSVPRLSRLGDWIPYWHALGVNALLLGPVSASTSHGYDTRDLYRIDPRLGDEAGFAELSRQLHGHGIRLVLDAVFHHVGREFFAFEALRRDPEGEYADWFHLRPGTSPLGDAFDYAGWEGHAELVKLNTAHPPVRDYLFGAVSQWIRDYDIDGLRLDVAYCLDADFLQDLAAHCRRLKPDFWLMGEIIHGDYRQLLTSLDAVTNYECFKGLWSSHVDRNAFEIAHSLQRLFGAGGLCQGRLLYNFADNHDVDRVASRFATPEALYSLYLLLLTMPGVPSLYYGSEWGNRAVRSATDDAALRPALNLEQTLNQAQASPLTAWIQRLAQLRQTIPALQTGDFATLAIRSEQLAFVRRTGDSDCIVALNMASGDADLPLDTLPPELAGCWEDALSGALFSLSPGGRLALPAHGGRVLRPAGLA